MHSKTRKLILPFVMRSKNYNLKGEAFFFFKKTEENWKLTGEYAQITEWDGYGKPNYLNQPGGNGFMTGATNKEIRDYRFSNFPKMDCEYSTEGTKKKAKESLVKFTGDLNELNKLLKTKTVKKIEEFVTGSNPSGGLQKPDSDPFQFIVNKDFKVDYANLLITFKRGSKINIFSILSNLENRGRGEVFEDAQVIDIEEFIDYLGQKLIPYGGKNSGVRLSMNRAIVEQNVSYLIKEGYSRTSFGIGAQPVKTKTNLFDLIETGLPKSIVKDDARVLWSKLVDQDIKSNSYSRDFVKDLKRYDRAHIVDNAKAIDKCYELMDKGYPEKVKEILRMLISGENYLLLTKEIHTYFDQGDIEITPEGRIIPSDDSDSNVEEFDKLLSGARKDIEPYMSEERKELLTFRVTQL